MVVVVGGGGAAVTMTMCFGLTVRGRGVGGVGQVCKEKEAGGSTGTTDDPSGEWTGDIRGEERGRWGR